MAEVEAIETCQVTREGVKCEHDSAVNAFAIRKRRAAALSSCGCPECLDAFMLAFNEMANDGWVFFAFCFTGASVPDFVLDGVPVVELKPERRN